MPQLACDIWTSNLRDRSLVLGRASHIFDVTLNLTRDARCATTRLAYSRFGEFGRYSALRDPK